MSHKRPTEVRMYTEARWVCWLQYTLWNPNCQRPYLISGTSSNKPVGCKRTITWIDGNGRLLENQTKLQILEYLHDLAVISAKMPNWTDHNTIRNGLQEIKDVCRHLYWNRNPFATKNTPSHHFFPVLSLSCHLKRWDVVLSKGSGPSGVTLVEVRVFFWAL